MARGRVRAAADRLGLEFTSARPGEVGGFEGFDVVVLDLDEMGAPALAPSGAKLVGFYSHVDVSLGEAAERAGIRAVRRGRFWSDLDSHLTG